MSTKKLGGPFKMKGFSGFGEGTGRKADKKPSPTKVFGWYDHGQAGGNIVGAQGTPSGGGLPPTPVSAGQGFVGFPGIGSGGGNVPTQPTPTQGGVPTSRRPVRTRPRRGTGRLR